MSVKGTGGISDDIRFILENALLAPSGDNTQPWHFKVLGNLLELLWDMSNVDASAEIFGDSPESPHIAYLTFGTAIENTCLAAVARGYRPEITYSPDGNQPKLIATVSLHADGSVTKDPLVDQIAKRCTNRKPYKREPLTNTELLALRNAGTPESLGDILVVQDRKSIDIIANNASLYDELLFSTKVLHEHLFRLISWTRDEDKRRRIGFYFPTLGAPSFTWVFMQLLRHWWIMRIGILLGFHKIIAIEQQITYRRASAYGAVLVRGNSLQDWIHAGRLVERLWLSASKVGLSLQPMTGLLYFSHAVATNKKCQETFSSEQKKRIADKMEEVAHHFAVEPDTIAFMFRVGHADPPSARASRRPFGEMVTIEEPNA